MSSRVLPRMTLACVLGAACAWGQSGGSGAPSGLPQNEIEKLVAPIALYPDVLVSQILPAATFPTDIVMAARWCQQNPSLNGLDDQKWDLSVISICRYPQVLDKLNQDLDWTNALGAAFLDQPNDVMTAIQELRERARDAGVLKSTPQQTVVSEGETILIAPAEKEVVYVPQYNPQVIYVEDDDDDGLVVAGTIAAGALSFGAGFALGAWLDNDCDWVHGRVVGCRPGYWGGWGYRGTVVAWDNDWVAARGPRRGFVAGPHGGAYVGPRGGAIWGDNGHGAAWTRPRVYGTPSYTGRYAGYNNVVGNRRNVVAGNNVTINRNNVNIDRGDRRAIRGGDRTNIGSGNRTNFGRDNRPNAGDRDRPAGADNRPNAGRDRPNPGGGAQPRQQPAARPSGDRKPSMLNDHRGGGEVRRSSSRGASSRGGGGGGRRGR